MPRLRAKANWNSSCCCELRLDLDSENFLMTPLTTLMGFHDGYLAAASDANPTPSSCLPKMLYDSMLLWVCDIQSCERVHQTREIWINNWFFLPMASAATTGHVFISRRLRFCARVASSQTCFGPLNATVFVSGYHHLQVGCIEAWYPPTQAISRGSTSEEKGCCDHSWWLFFLASAECCPCPFRRRLQTNDFLGLKPVNGVLERLNFWRLRLSNRVCKQYLS